MKKPGRCLVIGLSALMLAGCNDLGKRLIGFPGTPNDPPIRWEEEPTASFTPTATGTYRVVANHFTPGFSTPEMPTPRATFDIEVVAP